MHKCVNCHPRNSPLREWQFRISNYTRKGTLLMTLQQLRYVIQAADSRSMNEAAKALYISQPSLSGAIKELEKEIGIELFKRSSH